MEKRTVYRLPIVTCSFEGLRSVNCTMYIHVDVHVCIISTNEHVKSHTCTWHCTPVYDALYINELGKDDDPCT